MKKKTIAISNHKSKPAIMNILIYITIISIIYQCDAFLPSTANTAGCGISKNIHIIQSSTSRLFGIDEWREEGIQSKYTLDSYNTPASSQPYSDVPGVVPILPFPFSGKDTVFVHMICTILYLYL